MLNIDEIKNPQKSIFVCANAGSGKTFILVARVLSLLLSGEEPTKILCISFTESASSEIKDRIISKLKLWYSGKIEDEILLLNASEEEKKRAKNLYAEVILQKKMPKIMTFHAFCMQIVGLFSAESNLLYKPSILNENTKNSLQKKIFNMLMQNSKTKDFIDKMRGFFSIYSLKTDVIPKMLDARYRSIFQNQKDIKAVYEYLSLEDNQNSIEWWEEDFIQNFPFDELSSFLVKIEDIQITSTMQKKIDKIKLFYQNHDISHLREALLTDKGDMYKTPPFPAKHTQELAEWEIIQDYFAQKLELEKKVNTLTTTQNLMQIAGFIFEIYEAEKRKLEALDFDDFIMIASRVLKGEERDFILFKLDGGLRHILVDEAQDTNSLQWSVLNSILEEFFAGGETAKSLFVVGDDKQTIFSFQGSEPDALNDVLKRYHHNLTNLYLDTSYRTTKPILDFVDLIFSKEEYKKLISKQEYQLHKSSIVDGFGRVEICELPDFKKPEKKMQEEHFRMPFEEEEGETQKLVLANLITQKIVDILKEGRVILGKNRRVKPCDFMLLTKSRDEDLFNHLKVNLKNHNIEIAFCDKSPVSESLVLSDFTSLLKYLLNNKNTLALANVLRSPMFGCRDAELQDVFINSSTALVNQILDLKPLLLGDIASFFVEIFVRFKHKYSNAEIREFSYIFNIINDYKKTTSAPNFEGFVNFFDTICKNKEEFKIILEEDENAVKINTVHGSKGLESPIVFILNATEVFSKNDAKNKFVFDLRENIFLCSSKNYKCEEWTNLKDEEKELIFAEQMRLFYVALTRAKEEIYIFPKVALKKEKEEKDGYKSWYEIAKNALPSLKFSENGLELPQNGLELSQSEEVRNPEIKSTFVDNTKIEFKKIKIETATKRAEDGINLQIGSAIHEMLDSTKRDLQINYFEKKFNLLSSDIILTLWNKSLKIKQKFDFLFERGVLSELEIIQEISKNYIFKGKIDKLVIKDEVLIYDFKYQKVAKNSISHQLHLYCKAMQKIYPSKKIRCFALWVKEEEIEEIFF